MSSSDNNTGLQIDPRIFLSYLWKYWYIIFVGLALGGSYSYYHIRYTPATYQANSRMLLKDEYSSWGQEYFLPGMELVSVRNRLINEIGILKSFPVMEKVAKELRWEVSYFKIGNIKTTEMYPESLFEVKKVSGSRPSSTVLIHFLNANKFKVGLSQEELDKSKVYAVGDTFNINGSLISVPFADSRIEPEENYSFRFNSIDGLARNFQASLNIDVENKESSILILTEKNLTYQKSIDFLNCLMKTYINWGVEQNNKIASNTIDFVDNQLKIIADSLVITEFKLEQFQRKSFQERIFLNEENSNISEVIKLEGELTQRNVQRNYYATLIENLSNKDFSSFPSSAIFGFQDPYMDLQIEKLMGLLKKVEESDYNLREDNTLLAKYKMDVEKQRNTLLEISKSNKKQVEFLIDSLKNVIDEEEAKVRKIPQGQREYFNLKRENKLLSDLYTYLLNKRSEASIAKASNVPKAQVLDFASKYRVSYVGPNKSNAYVFGLIGGVGIPILIILIFYLANNTIVNPVDLKRVTNIPILGSISLKKGLDNNIVVNSNLKSIISESFRSIRTNINFMVEGKEKVKILVTSSISGEGKTFTSINLSAIYAASGKKTLLLGADMRKPKIFKDFSLTNSIGLSSFLINKSPIEECIQKTHIENLDLMASGPIPPNPAELIESKKMAELFDLLDSMYDIIIVDSPPLGLVTDALLLEKFVDSSIYIVRHNYTKQSYLNNINQLYKDGVVEKLGFVVNAVKNKGVFGKGGYGYGGYGYGGYGGYGYGYGYGYYSEDT